METVKFGRIKIKTSVVFFDLWFLLITLFCYLKKILGSSLSCIEILLVLRKCYENPLLVGGFGSNISSQYPFLEVLSQYGWNTSHSP